MLYVTEPRSDNRFTIPKEIMKVLGITPGKDSLKFNIVGDKVFLEKA